MRHHPFDRDQVQAVVQGSDAWFALWTVGYIVRYYWRKLWA